MHKTDHWQFKITQIYWHLNRSYLLQTSLQISVKVLAMEIRFSKPIQLLLVNVPLRLEIEGCKRSLQGAWFTFQAIYSTWQELHPRIQLKACETNDRKFLSRIEQTKVTKACEKERTVEEDNCAARCARRLHKPTVTRCKACEGYAGANGSASAILAWYPFWDANNSHGSSPLSSKLPHKY